MAKPRPWTPASHGPLTRLAEGLWQVEAELDALPIGRRMVVSQVADGTLAVHSAVACDDATMTEIEALGAIGWIVVPSGYHRLDAGAWKARYPEARVVTPPASRARVEQRVAVDGGLDLLPDGAPLSWQALDGVPAEAVLIHRDGDAVTLVFNDAFMNLPDRLPGFRGWVTKLIGSTGGPKVTRTARWFIVEDKPAYAAHLRRLAGTPGLARVVPGHGAVVDDQPAAALALAADRLHRG